jgi:hypothetical protein
MNNATCGMRIPSPGKRSNCSTNWQCDNSTHRRQAPGARFVRKQRATDRGRPHSTATLSLVIAIILRLSTFMATASIENQTTLSRWLERLTSPGQLAQRAERQVDLAFTSTDERFIWITDHGKRVGLIDKVEALFEWVAPHPGIDTPLPREVPAIYHAPTFQGGRIIAQWWICGTMGREKLPGQPWPLAPDAPSPRNIDTDNPVVKVKPKMVWRFEDAGGDSLRFSIAHTFAHDGSILGEHAFTLSYDPLADSYVADVAATLSAPNHSLIECCNFYTGGVYDNRPGRKRHQCTIWSHPDGRWVRWPHNPVGYMTPGMNSEERRIGAPPGENGGGGFIGYFMDPHTNPVLDFLECNFDLVGATCCNIYDEHLICLPPEGYTEAHREWRTRFRLYSLLPEVAAQVVRESALIDYGVDVNHPNSIVTEPGWSDEDASGRVNYNPQFPSFYYGCVNDFESPVPYDRTIAGSYIHAELHDEADVYWDRGCGHSGTSSIRVRGDDGAKAGARSNGPTPHLDPDTKYRLSGWIKCEDVSKNGARIRLDEIGFKPTDKHSSHIAGPVRGTCDWTYVEDTFTTPSDGQFGWLYLDLEGPGMAWFDDVALEEC